ncbi:Alpha/Beta hydrolase protein [Podospora aff. communis PSN243]|uniref:Feruloyl esterase C n=1 Tax=Podospora aff. communis PSN243 TaxID=3040156 RepID=A0AAV9GMJ9_9PEZI|nr:Alpha/Beta hydrolase protein [Podospora aff. communis PSN243]
MVALQSLLLGLLSASATLVQALPSSPLSSATSPNLNLTPLQTRQTSNPSTGCGKSPFSSGVKSLTVNGRTRQFTIRVPANYNPNRTYRLIFAFHWVGGTMNDISSGGTDRELWSYYGMQRNAGESAILVAPQGINNGWANNNGEDISFVDAMINYIESALCVNKRQRFALGFSYGGSMSFSVACSRAKEFRAVAVMGGGQLSGCNGGNDPIAYLGIHGTTDGVLGIAQGRAMRDRFVRNNGCQQGTNAPEPGRGSGIHIKTNYGGCRQGFPVTWIPFDGGHWPGAVDNGPESGARSWVPGEIWGFFTQGQLAN